MIKKQETALERQWEALRLACEELNGRIARSITGFGDAVAQLAFQLEGVPASERMLALDTGLVMLETCQRELERVLGEAYALEDQFAACKMELALAECAEVEKENFAHLSAIKDEISRTEVAFSERRTTWDRFCQATVPAFLERLSSLTEGAHPRLASILSLCGELEHEAERLLRA